MLNYLCLLFHTYLESPDNSSITISRTNTLVSFEVVEFRICGLRRNIFVTRVVVQ